MIPVTVLLNICNSFCLPGGVLKTAAKHWLYTEDFRLKINDVAKLFLEIVYCGLAMWLSAALTYATSAREHDLSD